MENIALDTDQRGSGYRDKLSLSHSINRPFNRVSEEGVVAS